MAINELFHYGTPRHSGRYPWGSGENPQRNKTFLGRTEELKNKGYSQKEIADALGISTTSLRAKKAIELEREKKENVIKVIKLKNKGLSTMEISRRTGISESTLRGWLKNAEKAKESSTEAVATILRDQVDKKKFLDVGAGVERQINVSDTKLRAAVQKLKEEGYTLHNIYVKQATNVNKNTSIKVLTKDDVPMNEVYKNLSKVQSITDSYIDNGTIRLIKDPVSISSKRIKVVYNEEGGTKKDGLIEVRPGVEDLTLGRNRYCQVRIAVDGTHYAKGMAAYSDNIPDGYDIVINTNKHIGTPITGPKDNSVLKPLKSDPDNPFGSTIRQWDYTDKKGEKHLSPINIVNEDKDWEHWSKNVASQMLSKQTPAVAKQQLKIVLDQQKSEFDKISKLTNPTVKKKLLEEFASDCDSKAVHLKAAAFPRQATHVILPLTSLSSKEIYAPDYEDGEEVVLVRYPHGGIFEIPRLVVNNSNREGRKLIGTDTHTAVGINSIVAEQLSGADFDGDTVIVIPTRGLNIKTSKPLEALKDFSTTDAYPAYEGMPRVGTKNNKFDKQMEMGKASNLITDMTIKGASPDEIAKAVKYSMVVIDAEKHNLDWKRAYEECNIASLKKEYQGKVNGGASTLISLASSEYHDKDRVEISPDPETGQKRYRYTGKTKNVYNPKTGEWEKKEKTVKSTKMAETEDAFTLSSGTPIETVYANHANALKLLGNNARKEILTIVEPSVNPTAKAVYAQEVASLSSKLNIALLNAPKERRAQMLAYDVIQTKRKANPDMDSEEEKKLRDRSIAIARVQANSNKKATVIDISPKEWEAIDAGAISKTMLDKILNNTDMDIVRNYATPSSKKGMTASEISRAKNLLSRGYTQAEVAADLGISVTTLNNNLN